MGRQDGILQIKGEVGGMSFYKTTDGYLVRKKSSVNKNRILNDPAFQRTRENGQEFGKAGAAGKLMRNALSSLIKNAADSKMVGRLTKAMVRVLQADATNDRGQRNIMDGETELLTGFEFNANANLNTVMSAPFTTSIDRVTGTLQITVPPFVPGDMIKGPAGATHFRLVAAGLEIDFEAEEYVVDLSQSANLVIGPEQQAQVELTNAVTPNATSPLFLLFGIEFGQQVNGKMYPIKSKGSNTLAIVAVNGGV